MRSWRRSPGPPCPPCSGGERLSPQASFPTGPAPTQPRPLPGGQGGRLLSCASHARARYSEVSYLELDKFLEDVR